MSKLVLTRERVEGTARHAIGITTRRLAWQNVDGLCPWCNAPVPWIGPEVQYDHWIPLALGGADVLANIAPMHTRPCHLAKTAEDVRRIAKAKRQSRLLGLRRAPRRPLHGRGFLTHLSRGFDGLVRRKPPKDKDLAA